MDKEKVIISGINGFVGHHLARELHNADLLVIGVGQDEEADADITSIVSEYHQTDLTEQWPDIPNVKAVIHLAGLAAVGPSFDNPQAYINANSSMVTNLCEYYVKQDAKPRVVIVSSGAIYNSNQPMPIAEDGEIGFSSPYAISKILNENQVAYYRNRGLDCVVARPFNHIGPGQNPGFILPDFYSRLSSLENGEQTISIGNIETRRDYTDVRDIVRAYGKIALAPTLKHSVYNICSGVSLSGVEMFTELKNAMNLTDVGYEIDQSLVRPTDIKDILGDASRLKNELGWEPQIDIRQTVIDFVKSKS
ncbi:GDP-mannose 4,6-dehydratase [Candidatus Saccharibacteria bacterium]|nr:GDP-mannose 4,6-dehydratase [Candidatus Saccharibacteria bacterium]